MATPSRGFALPPERVELVRLDEQSREGPIDQASVVRGFELWMKVRDEGYLQPLADNYRSLLHDFYVLKVTGDYLRLLPLALDEDAGKRQKVGRRRVEELLNVWMKGRAEAVIRTLPAPECRTGLETNRRQMLSHAAALVPTKLVQAMVETGYRLSDAQLRSFVSILVEEVPDRQEVDRILAPMTRA